MEPTKFRINIKSPIGLTLDLQKDIYCQSIPEYRLLELELSKIDENKFCLTARFNSEDINSNTPKEELFNIRDRLLALLSITAMIPVELCEKGVFTFHLGDDKYQALSLGPMNRESSPVALNSLQPFVQGLSLPTKYATAMYLIWQAINSDEPLYRFVNSAICVELLVGADSPEISSVNPRCPNNNCNYLLEKCPTCGKSWTIPNSLRNKAKFIIPDEETLSRFISARNKVFHGSSHQQDAKFHKELSDISVPVLLAIRNHMGKKIGLSPMKEKDLKLAFHNIDLMVGISFTTSAIEP